MKTGMAAVTIILALAFPAFSEPASAAPSLRIVSQGLKGDAVIVSEVVAQAPGWVAVHVEKDGVPAEVIGWTPVPAGASSFLYVRLDLAKVAAKLVAVLHEDRGKPGSFEYPGPDAVVATPAGLVAGRFVLAGCRGAVNCDIGLAGSPIDAAFQ